MSPGRHSIPLLDPLRPSLTRSAGLTPGFCLVVAEKTPFLVPCNRPAPAGWVQGTTETGLAATEVVRP